MVIAIIALLASILLPVLGKVQDNAKATQCASNLRQIGAAINAYATDNDGSLPGPLALWQYAISTDDQQLCKRVGQYVGLSTTPGASTPTERTSIFVCPANLRENTTLAAPVYVLNPLPIADLKKPPFGDPAAGTDPVRKPMLSNWIDATGANAGRPIDLTRTWAMKDADQQAFIGNTIAVSAPAGAAPPLKPVHGAYRNALFYDWHVGKLNADPARNDEVK